MSDTTYVYNGQYFHPVVGSSTLASGADAHLTDCGISVDKRCKTTTDATLAATKQCPLCDKTVPDDLKTWIAKQQGAAVRT